MKKFWAWLVERKTRKFFATLPPVATKGDGGAWILDKFKAQNGREFNPFSSRDREIVRSALSRAIVAALPALFPSRPA